MKLLIVIGTLARMGGAERQALYFVEHLSRLPRCQPEVLTFQDGNALRPALDALRVPVHVVPYDVGWVRSKRMRVLARLVALLRLRVKPDAILPFGTPASKTIGLVWRLSGARFAWWNQQDEGRGLAGTPAERKILRSVPSVNSNSVAGRIFLSATYGLKPESVLVYNNGTPVPDASTGGGEWRRKLKVGNRKVVAMIANVTRFKDHETLLEAWAAVKRHFADTDMPVLLLAGGLIRPAFAASLKTKAFDLGLSADDVRFLGAVEDVRGLLGECDLIVHSSLTEGCPNAVCEAMAAGRAVIATDIPGCRQALGDAAQPWLVEAKNPSVLAERIVTMLENDDLRIKCGQANRERIQSEFSVGGMNDFFLRQVEAGLGCSVSA